MPDTYTQQHLSSSDVFGQGKRRIAFLFILPSCFYQEPLWHEYFRGEPAEDYMIVVHQQSSSLNEATATYSSIAFQGAEAREAVAGPIHYVPSLSDAARYSLSLARVGGLLMRQAYFSQSDAECFVLMSDTTVPLMSLPNLRELMIDGNGKCISSINVVTPGEENVMKQSQWLVLSREELALLLQYGQEDAEAAAIRIIEKQSEPGKKITFTFDETLYPTAMSVVYGAGGGFTASAPTKEGVDYTAVFWDDGYLQWDKMLPLTQFLLGMSPKSQFYAGTPTDGTFNEAWGHPAHFDAALLASVPMRKLVEICEKPFLRKVVLNSVFHATNKSLLRTCGQLKQEFVKEAKIDSIEW
jgi:hypothetical protein